MKLYYHPGSSSSRRARFAAALLNIDLELVLVDVFAGAHKKPEYLAINPNGMIPTLDDGGFLLWESSAIAQYLASKKSTPDLLPNDPKTRADVTRWQLWDIAHWNRWTQTLAHERVFKKIAKMGDPDPAVVELATTNFHRFAKVLNGHLEGRDYLVGKSITLADVAVATGFTYAVPAAIPVEGYKHIQRWFASIEKLDAWRKTAPPMG